MYEYTGFVMFPLLASSKKSLHVSSIEPPSLNNAGYEGLVCCKTLLGVILGVSWPNPAREKELGIQYKDPVDGRLCCTQLALPSLGYSCS